MNTFDFAKLGPEALVIGGLLHLHWRINRVEGLLNAIGTSVGAEMPPPVKRKAWRGLPLWLLCAFVAFALSGCATVTQSLHSRTEGADGASEERTLTVRVSAVGDAKQAVEKLRASSGKTLSVGVEGASGESASPSLAEFVLELLRRAGK